MFEIEIEYITGDSFNTNECIEPLPHVWNDIEVVKTNVKRIKQHNDWYNDKENSYKPSPKNIPMPDFMKELHTVDINELGIDQDTLYTYMIPLKLDNGDVKTFHCFWIGYFESLQKIRVEVNIG